MNSILFSYLFSYKKRQLSFCRTSFSRTKRPVLQLIAATLVATPLISFSQESTLVHITKRNALNFAIEGDNNSGNGQNIHLWQEDFENVNQQWEEVDRGDGYYSYRNVDRNTCLDGNDGGRNGQNLYLLTCNEDSHNQHWLKTDVGDGYYRLEKRNAPTFSIDGRSNGRNGQNVHVWTTVNGNQNQHWLFQTITKAITTEHPKVQMTKRNASSFAIDADDGGNFGQNVFILTEDINSVNQQWFEIDRGNNYFTYQKVDTEFCIDGRSGGANAQNVYLWGCDESNHNQHWLKVDVGDGFFRLQKRNAPGFSLDGRTGGRNRQNVHLYDSSNKNQNQHWSFNAVEAPVASVSIPNPPVALPPVKTSVPVTAPIAVINDSVETDEEAVDFLIAASFGPTDDSVDQLQRLGYSEWFKQQTNLPINSLLTETRSRLNNSESANRPTLDRSDPNRFNACSRDERFSREAWMKFAVTNEDQLRQRVAFALSQLFVVATNEDLVRCKSWMQGNYLDVLQEGAFGNFRDVLEEVTYHPFMARWLTYLNSEKADPITGSMPDENYAREIMQLFTIGLVELNIDGSQRLDENGQAIETYTQDDITELAKVFTGLKLGGFDLGGSDALENNISDTSPLEINNFAHSTGGKTVLGRSIPEYSDGNNSVSDALDILTYHPNTAPFVAKHLIKRLTTSNPSPAYISDVASAFISGSFTLPNGDVIGSQTYGDLESTVAAVLFFEEARSDDRFTNNVYGKVREPVLRFVQWARVSGVSEFDLPLLRIGETNLGMLGQDLPIRARSVFNFFRPGYMAAGSETAGAGLVAPELQIEVGPNMVEYANSMQAFIFTNQSSASDGGYFPDYDASGLLERATTSEEIVNYFNLIYTANRLHPDTIEAMISALDTVAPDDTLLRLQMASAMIVNTTEYKTQK